MSRGEPGFCITRQKGFHVTFENGYTVSVQFGWGNYCENRDIGDGEPYPTTTEEHRSRDLKAGAGGCVNAETAVWGPDGALIQLEGDSDTVQGWQTPAQVLQLLSWAASHNA